VVVEVEEVGEEALRIKGSSAFMSSWSEDDDEELSWFEYKSVAAIGKMGKRLGRLKTGGKGLIFFCLFAKTELKTELTEKEEEIGKK